MKKSSTYSLISILLFSIILSSCSNKFSIQKRKYTKGFYFASASKKNQTLSNSQKQVEKSTPVTSENETETDYSKPTNVINHAEPNFEDIKPQTFVVAKSQNKHFQKKSAITYVSDKKNVVEKKITKEIISFKKKRDGFFEVLRTMYIGYLVIGAIVFLYVLFTELAFAEAIAIVGLIVLSMLVLYAIGSLFT